MPAVSHSRYALFFAIAGCGCGLDLLSKRWIFDRLGMPHHEPTEWLWKPVFGFTTSLNEGALFGIGQGQIILIVGLSVAATLGILYYLFVARAASDLLLTIALAAVMAGILGNLYDRLGLPGLRWDGLQRLHPQGDPVRAVRDWLDFQLIHWPIFNIADSLLVGGAGLLVWHAFRPDSRGGADSSTLVSETSETPQSTKTTSAR